MHNAYIMAMWTDKLCVLIPRPKPYTLATIVITVIGLIKKLVITRILMIIILIVIIG